MFFFDSAYLLSTYLRVGYRFLVTKPFTYFIWRTKRRTQLDFQQEVEKAERFATRISCSIAWNFNEFFSFTWTPELLDRLLWCMVGNVPLYSRNTSSYADWQSTEEIVMTIHWSVLRQVWLKDFHDCARRCNLKEVWSRNCQFCVSDLSVIFYSSDRVQQFTELSIWTGRESRIADTRHRITNTQMRYGRHNVR